MGTSAPAGQKRHEFRDHPHAYGDKDFCCADVSRSIGSSPRVWGQEIMPKYNELYSRIIPTRMGTRVSDDMTFLKKEDHPHAYGDKYPRNPEP